MGRAMFSVHVLLPHFEICMYPLHCLHYVIFIMFKQFIYIHFSLDSHSPFLPYFAYYVALFSHHGDLCNLLSINLLNY